jgi:hypothetical protein
MLHCDAASLSAACAVTAPMPCPDCGDWMIAPLVSEFVVAGEIRHHWICDSCGKSSTTSIPLANL